MKHASTKEIQAFLIQCRQIIRSKDIITTSFVLVHSAKNKKTMLTLGFTEKQVVEEIETLSLTNFADGPRKDKDLPGMLWVFGKWIKEREVYIKLKISPFDDPGNKVATLTCLSFHFSEEALRYPYKTKEEA